MLLKLYKIPLLGVDIVIEYRLLSAAGGGGERECRESGKASAASSGATQTASGPQEYKQQHHCRAEQGAYKTAAGFHQEIPGQ